MKPLSFKRHRSPSEVICHAVWLYFRFTLSLRDVEDLLAERGIDVTCETVHCRANKFGPAIATNIRGDCRRTIARKPHISPFDDGSERCSVSSPKGRLSASFQPTPRSTTPSPFSVILLPDEQCETSDPPLLRVGTQRPLPRHESPSEGPSRAWEVNLTIPGTQLAILLRVNRM